MRKYLATLHEKPDHHKRRFAFLASGLVTLVIFVSWSLVTFGTGGLIAQNDVEETPSNELGPLASLKAGLGSGIAGLAAALSGFGTTLKEAVDFESDYTEMRDKVLNTYGQ